MLICIKSAVCALFMDLRGSLNQGCGREYYKMTARDIILLLHQKGGAVAKVELSDSSVFTCACVW